MTDTEKLEATITALHKIAIMDLQLSLFGAPTPTQQIQFMATRALEMKKIAAEALDEVEK